MIIYGIPSSILSSLTSYYYFNIFGYQSLYLHFLCTYLELKIENLSQNLNDVKQKKQFPGIRPMLYKYNALLCEINEYNKTYWSKFLAIFWILFGNIVSINIYKIIFVEMPLINTILLTYVFPLFFTFLNLIISKVCSFNNKLYKKYKILRSLNIQYTRRPITRITHFLTIEKVSKIMQLLNLKVIY
jgi:hypothetical protein